MNTDRTQSMKEAGTVVPSYTSRSERLLKMSFRWIFLVLFRARVSGLEYVEKAGAGSLVIANHLSFLDAVMLTAFLPGRMSFAVDTEIAKSWWMRPVRSFFDIIMLSPTSPLSIRTLIESVKSGRTVVIFPEGRITITGALMKVYEGPGLIVDKTGATVVPVRLEGLQYTYFGKAATGLPRRLFPHLSLTVSKPVQLQVDPNLRGRARREKLALKLHDLMTESYFDNTQRGPTLLHSLFRTTHIWGSSHPAIKDPLSGQVTLGGLLKKSFVLSRILPRGIHHHRTVGVLLPTGIPLLAVFFAFQWRKQLPALLNYSHSPDQMSATAKISDISAVLTSKRFIAAGKLEKHLDRLTREGSTVYYLEDLASTVSSVNKLLQVANFYAFRLKQLLTRRSCFAGAPDEPAVVLFTSGSEGVPKGVVLSHGNLLSNIDQVIAMVPVRVTDKVFNALPMFHSFGLTGGTLMPLLKGIPLYLYPSPLHYRIIPEMVYNEASTILFGTPTFLTGYAKKANAYDFFNVRYIFAGAEKVPDALRSTFQERYGIRIFEGYGTTETSPIIAVNSPFYSKSGTVGRLLPGMGYRLEQVDGVPNGGRLFVAGPNIMQGYLLMDRPGILQPLDDVWYDTGDIVSVDEQDFITIIGRAKRFAKIGGEMISLGAIEQLIEAHWPKTHHAIVIVPDERKGEKLILVTSEKNISREDLTSVLRKGGLPDIAIPREIRFVQKLPLLGSGKIDLQQLNKEIDTIRAV